MLEENTVAALSDPVGLGGVMDSELACCPLSTKVTGELVANILAAAIGLQMSDRLSALDPKPCLVSLVLLENLVLSPNALNSTKTTMLIDPGDSVVLASDSANRSGPPNIRVNDIADLLCRMGSGLRKREAFDLRECADFTKVNFSILKHDSS